MQSYPIGVAAVIWTECFMRCVPSITHVM